MAANSKIQWTTHTFNPWRGCSKVHTGCANCYAEATSKRNETILGTWGPNGTRVVAAERAWAEVLKWNKAAAKLSERPRVFCASLADVFEHWAEPMVDHLDGDHYTSDVDPSKMVNHEEMHGLDSVGYHYTTIDDVRRRLFALIDSTPALDWLLLTKRPENVRKFWPAVNVQSQEQADDRNERGELYRRNVWIGTSISDQETADKATPELLELRDLAPVLFLSAEPLVGPVDLCEIRDAKRHPGCACFDVLRGQMIHEDDDYQWTPAPSVNLVIVGGESGPGARPCSVEWVRAIVRQCAEAGVACFVKQLGANVEIDHAENASDYGDGVSIVGNEGDSFGPTRLKFTDPKGGNPDEWPEDLRVRQMPERI